jgi:hypothetical protein
MCDQYKEKCDNDCGTVLDEDCPIMCYKDKKNEWTICAECYWDAEYYLTDLNEDNAGDIEEYVYYNYK